MAAARATPRSEPAKSHDLACQGKAAKGPLGGVVGEAHSTVDEEAGKSVPALEHAVAWPGDGGRARQTRKRNTISYVVKDPKSSACATLGTAKLGHRSHARRHA
jgi:hypothetical protein